MSIRVNMGQLDTANERRARRDALGDTMKQIWKRFRTEGLDFNAVFQRELRAIPEAAIEVVQARCPAVGWRVCRGGRSTPWTCFLNSLSRLFTGAAKRFEEAGSDPEDAKKKAVEFLYSDHAVNAPQNRLSAMLFAALARRAVAGKRVPNRGTPNDIDVISSYSPYCDAIFVDDEFAELLREELIAPNTLNEAVTQHEKNIAFLEPAAINCQVDLAVCD